MRAFAIISSIVAVATAAAINSPDQGMGYWTVSNLGLNIPPSASHRVFNFDVQYSKDSEATHCTLDNNKDPLNKAQCGNSAVSFEIGEDERSISLKQTVGEATYVMGNSAFDLDCKTTTVGSNTCSSKTFTVPVTSAVA
ncbi:uncharacterized protein K452DRAFT_317034 [Aplosporella prunicola CBS 121167]|uniref:AA1-like domain-containing protein n=1 Tax=Aplosporella prunicola CBS 121167 TaxID=1176127 RepID=A0A6A6BJP0_9PEZI|nr:uncharacterized protein K452DRAFT_317034 [Aplosporella prunicola CBS 121167]KAF2143545.1 hypothetical protein K452DRAFT_317034 [Aplosporella prunicola CBS 121167]